MGRGHIHRLCHGVGLLLTVASGRSQGWGMSCPELTVPRLPSVSDADPCWPSWRWKCKKSMWVLGTGCSRKCPLSRAPGTPPSSSTFSRQPPKRKTNFPRTCARSSCRPWAVTGRSCLSGRDARVAGLVRASLEGTLPGLTWQISFLPGSTKGRCW